MTVGIQLGNITDEIGSGSFFFSFFSTISGNLESRGWGSRFPVLMKKLYQGELKHEDAASALAELDEVTKALADLAPDKVIWDIDDRGKSPPWGDDIAETIADLSNYFVTSTGRDLIGVLREVFEELRDKGGVARVVNY